MAFLNDTFTGTDGTFLPAHDANWEELPFDVAGAASSLQHIIGANHLVADSSNTWSQVLRYNADPGGDEYDLTATVAFRANPQSGRQHTLFVRMTPTVTTYATTDYYVVTCDGSANIIQLHKVVAGVLTELDSAAFSWTTGVSASTYVVRIEARSTGVEVFVDDVSVLSTTDVEITQRGRVGVSSRRGDSFEHYIDDMVGEVPVTRPIADAGPNQNVSAGSTGVQLAGTPSDGGGAGAPYTYLWEILTDTTGGAVLSSATVEDPTLDLGASAGSVTLGFTVTDSALVASTQDTVTITAIGEGATAIPISDITTTGWSEEPDDGLPIANSLGDDNFTTYAFYPDPAGTVVLEVALSELIEPQPGEAVSMWFRSSMFQATSGTVTMILKEGPSTVIATSGPHNWTDPEIVQDFSYDLTQTEIDAVTDWANLRLRFEGTVT